MIMNSSPVREWRLRLIALLFAAFITPACADLFILFDDKAADPGVGPYGAKPAWSDDEHKDGWATWEGAPIDELLKLWGPPSYIHNDGSDSEYVWEQSKVLWASDPANKDFAGFPNQITRRCDIKAKIDSGTGIIKNVWFGYMFGERSCGHFKPKPPRPLTGAEKSRKK